MNTKTEILNLFDEFNDYQESLNDIVCEYEIGKSKITFVKPLALEKKNQDKLVRNQFISQAVATEYNTLQEEYNKIFEGELTRELAERAFEIRIQSDNKLIELNLLTIEYLEILASLETGQLEKIIKGELPKHLVKIELSAFVNKIFQSVTDKIAGTEVKSEKVEYDEQKKLSQNELEITANNLETSYTSSEATTDYLVMTH